MQKTLNVGDKIHATPEIDGLAKWKKATWVATIVSKYPTCTGDDSDGFCYVTEGRWSDEPKSGLTSRQLYSRYMVAA